MTALRRLFFAWSTTLEDVVMPIVSCGFLLVLGVMSCVIHLTVGAGEIHGRVDFSSFVSRSRNLWDYISVLTCSQPMIVLPCNPGFNGDKL